MRAFVESPSEKFLDQCTRDQLVKIAEYYEVDVGDKRLKETVRANLKVNLTKMNVLGTVEAAAASGGTEDLSPPVIVGPGAAGLTFEQQKELLVLRMQLEREKEVAVEKMRQGIEMEKVVSLEKMRTEIRTAELELQRQRLTLISEGKVAADVLLADNPPVSGGTLAKSDVLGDLRLVPKFNERDPDVFFSMFERLAEAWGWPDSTCTLMLQCVLTGRAQEAYAALSNSDCVRYDLVKSAVLKAYELVPEAYHQRFRSVRRGDKSHLEFARDLSTHFDRWCAAAEVNSYEALRDLIILEQFKNSVPERIATYINERSVKTAAKAAALADDYGLTHGGECSGVRGGSGHRENSSAGGTWSGRPVRPVVLEQRSERGRHDFDKICNYCHKRGHWRRDCYALKSKTQPTDFPQFSAESQPEADSLGFAAPVL